MNESSVALWFKYSLSEVAKNLLLKCCARATPKIVYRKCANLAKQDPGRARLNSQARAPGNGGQSVTPTESRQSVYKTSITPNERTNVVR